MVINVSVADNLDDNSPGVDFTITGLASYNTITLERVDTSGEYSTVPVRGFDLVDADATMVGSDYEAPINRPLKYRVTAQGDDPEIEWHANSATMSGATTVTVTYPSGIGADHLTLLAVTMKPYNATLATPSGWTLLAEHTNGTVSSGADVGSTHLYLFRKEGSASGTEVITPSGCNSVAAKMVVYKKNPSAGPWDYTISEGADSTNGANFSASGTTTFSASKKNDMFSVFAGINSDEGSTSNRAFSLPNTGFDTAMTFDVQGFTSGDDGRLLVGYGAEVGSSTASGTPNVSYTNSASTSGTAIFLRLSTTSTSSASAESSIITLGFDSHGDAWIKSVSVPELSRKVAVVDWNTTEYTTRVLSTYKVLGRPKPVVLTDRWGAREGEITVCTDNDNFTCTWQQLNQLVIEGQTLLFQTAGSDISGEKDMYFEVTGFTRTRQERVIRVDGTNIFFYKISFTEVDRPATIEESLGLRSYQDVLDQNGTYEDLINNYPDPDDTYLAVLISQPA